jgi:hypothetical protein
MKTPSTAARVARADGQITSLAGELFVAAELLKAVRKRNAFPISYAKVHANHIYIFVILNKPSVPVQYFIVPGTILANEPERFTKWFLDPKFPGIPPAALKPFEDAWAVFSK